MTARAWQAKGILPACSSVRSFVGAAGIFTVVGDHALDSGQQPQIFTYGGISMNRMVWTQELDRQLTAGWEAGHSATVIGREMGGLTKNAVIGRAHRIGLHKRPSPINKDAVPSERAIARRAANARTLPPLASDAIKVVPVPKPKRMEALKRPVPVVEPEPEPAIILPTMPCQYPAKAGPRPRSWILCEATSLPGKVYCKTHHRKCYVRVDAKVDLAPWVRIRRAA